MAQRVIISLSRNSGHSSQNHFTMNETPIGENQRNNNKGDIELIQFFLREFYSVRGDLFGLLPRISRSPFFTIDGKCGRQTKEGIYKFQLDQQLRGAPILVDGIVHETKNLVSPSRNLMYTIWWLNKWFFVNSMATIAQKEDLRLHPVVRTQAPSLMRELNRPRPNRVII